MEDQALVLCLARWARCLGPSLGRCLRCILQTTAAWRYGFDRGATEIKNLGGFWVHHEGSISAVGGLEHDWITFPYIYIGNNNPIYWLVGETFLLASILIRLVLWNMTFIYFYFHSWDDDPI